MAEKRGVSKALFKKKKKKWGGRGGATPTYSTNNLLALSDARGFEHHTTEAC